MGSRRGKGREAAEVPTGHFLRREHWNGLTPGEAVRIAGIRGGHFRYRCHVTNPHTGEVWVEVAELDLPGSTRAAASVAGAGEARPLPVRRVRSFAEERVLPLRRGRRPVAPGQGAFDLGLPAGEPARRPVATRRRAARGAAVEAPRLPLWADPAEA